MMTTNIRLAIYIALNNLAIKYILYYYFLSYDDT